MSNHFPIMIPGAQATAKKEVRAPYDGKPIATIDAGGAAAVEKALATAYAPASRPRCLAATGEAHRDPEEGREPDGGARRGAGARGRARGRQAARRLARRGRARDRRHGQLRRDPAQRGGPRDSDEHQRCVRGSRRVHAARADRRRGGTECVQPPGQPDRPPGRPGDRCRLPGDRQAGRRHAAVVHARGRDPARGRPAGRVVPGAASRSRRTWRRSWRATARVGVPELHRQRARRLDAALEARAGRALRARARRRGAGDRRRGRGPRRSRSPSS